MKIVRVIAALLIALIIFSFSSVYALEIKDPNLSFPVNSALLMDAKTGTVLYSYNMNERFAPASVTKIMTLILVFEAIENGILSLNTELTVSEHAASMGGSQVFLEPGEAMSVDELLKCVIVASANDAAVTLAEHVFGSEEAFVSAMNEKAIELGMENTTFENVTGLDDDVSNHLTTALDIGIMSRELLKYDKVKEYTTIWIDSIRDGEFTLTNTNRLVRYYKGITGLKTGSTSAAGFCISASAKRGNTELIAVIMGAETSKLRNEYATKLLDYGFANYSTYLDENESYGCVKVTHGKAEWVEVFSNEISLLENKGNETKIEKEVVLPKSVEAPILKNQAIGKIVYRLNGSVIFENNLYAANAVEKINIRGYVLKIFLNIFIK